MNEPTSAPASAQHDASTVEIDICPSCNGSGENPHAPAGMGICPACGGDGEVAVTGGRDLDDEGDLPDLDDRGNILRDEWGGWA